MTPKCVLEIYAQRDRAGNAVPMAAASPWFVSTSIKAGGVRRVGEVWMTQDPRLALHFQTQAEALAHRTSQPALERDFFTKVTEVKGE